MKQMLTLTTMVVVLAGAACRAHDIRDAGGNALTNRWLYSSGDGIGKIEKFEPSLTLNAGQVSGWTGCNHLQADFSVSGNTIKIRQKMKTSLPCPSQAAVAGEQAFENLLQSVARYETGAGVLRLITPEGKQLVMRAYVPAPRAALVGSEWKMLSAAMLPGAVGTSEMIQAHRATFDTRRLRLSQPCYEISADYAASEAGMSFSNVSVVQRACTEKREAEFTLQYLQPMFARINRYTISERRLSLYAGEDFQLDFEAKP
jgi:heat shock protein HslJ